MKINLIVAFVSMIAFNTFSQDKQLTTKHALIIAIGDYPVSGGWRQISGTRDIPFIERALTNQKFTDIKVLKNEEVTPAGIGAAFQALSARVKPGDVVVIHVSSHGQQIEDDNGDETDGLDESIVTYNAVLPKNKGVALTLEEYKNVQVNYLRDDQFGKMVDNLRNKLGREGDVVVFIDACHSGTATRGFARVRGGEPPLISTNFKSKNGWQKDTEGVFNEKMVDNNSLATYVLISASLAEELNAETKDDNHEPIGSLTYAISKVFESLNHSTTYRTLFSQIQAVMNAKVPGQHPVLEGSGTDRSLFGGRFQKQQPFIVVEKIKGKEVTLNAGSLSGLAVGAKVALDPAGLLMHDPTKTVAKGTITKTDPYSSLLTLDKVLPSTRSVSLWGFVTEPVYTIEPVVVNIVSKTPTGANGDPAAYTESETTTIKSYFTDMPLVQFTGEPELLLVKGTDSDTIKIASNGYVFRTVERASNYNEGLKEAFQRYAQYKLLQNVKGEFGLAKVEVKLLSVEAGKAQFDRERNIFSDGDEIAIWIKNISTVPLYFNILDLQPDGVINPILPNNRPAQGSPVTVDELRLLPHQYYLSSERKYSLKIGLPAGTERFKVFVSQSKINMQDIADTRGATTRGNLSSLEMLVRDSYNITRGVTGSGSSDGSVYDLVFEIKEKD